MTLTQPDGDIETPESVDDVILQVKDLVVEFPADRGRVVHAVSGVSFELRSGETLGIVGESGCGKSTTGRAIVQLPSPTSGSVTWRGTELTELAGEKLRETRPALQIIFQDPISSLNPRRTVREIVAEGMRIHGESKAVIERRVDEVLDAVGLDPEVAGSRRPREFSGGQCQRICIARALALRPEVIICDEPVSALDVSVQAQILNLLEDTKERYGLSLVFISHDLAVVKSISDRVVVMYLGKICETATSEDLFSNPVHHYTRLLLDSVLDVDVPPGDVASAEGELPSPLDPPSGCRFRTRCPAADQRCQDEEPILRELGSGHFVACHHP